VDKIEDFGGRGIEIFDAHFGMWISPERRGKAMCRRAGPIPVRRHALSRRRNFWNVARQAHMADTMVEMFLLLGRLWKKGAALGLGRRECVFMLSLFRDLADSREWRARVLALLEMRADLQAKQGREEKLRNGAAPGRGYFSIVPQGEK